MGLLWLKAVPTQLADALERFSVGLLFLLMSVCCDTAQILVFLLVSKYPSLGVLAGVKVL